MEPALADPPRAVLELFTSQGCSSCPPADAVLADLARQPDIVALSFNVNYWDYLGWKDTLAHDSFTARQKAYAHARSDRQIFTPQMIVNGRKSLVGSDRAKIEKMIETVSDNRKGLPVDISVAEGNGMVRIAIEELDPTSERNAEVWLLPVTRQHVVPIERGENRGRTITYANVVRGLKRIGEWHGGPARFEVPLATARGDADGYVVLLQVSHGETKPGPILGAAKSPGL